MIGDLFFPPKCLSCNRPGKMLCFSCRRKIKPLNQIRRFPESSRFKGVLVLYPYRSLVGKIIRDFKYQGVNDLEEVLVSLIVSGLEENRLLEYWRKNNFVFLPLPLFPLRKLWRGFNQAERLLEVFAPKLGLKFSKKVLVRNRLTKPQSSLKAVERKINLKKAFTLKPRSNIVSQKFVVFDDVFTSGSSLVEAARAFPKDRKVETWGLVIAG